ncbi:MAG: hypothetical protein AB7G93_00965 [Bdellovibrionales bacterium]
MTMRPILTTFLPLVLAACASLSKNTPSKQSAPKTPRLKNAEVKTIWIPDRIEGNRYEEGHFIHLIDKPAIWSGQ